MLDTREAEREADTPLLPFRAWLLRLPEAGVEATALDRFLTDLTATRRDDLSNGAALQLLGGEENFEERLTEVDPLTLLRDAGTTGVPTVLLHGAADEEVPLTQFSDYAVVHRDLRTLVLPGTGHYTLIEPGAPGARAVADTLREMAAAFAPGNPGRAGEEAAHR